MTEKRIESFGFYPSEAPEKVDINYPIIDTSLFIESISVHRNISTLSEPQRFYTYIRKRTISQLPQNTY
jgi:hypothetical protein